MKINASLHDTNKEKKQKEIFFGGVYSPRRMLPVYCQFIKYRRNRNNKTTRIRDMTAIRERRRTTVETYEPTHAIWQPK